MNKLEDFQPLRPAEEKLRAAAQAGETAVIAQTRPEASGRTDDNTVRADFIRYLALGGCASCGLHQGGLRLHGAWIDGGLNLHGCDLPRGLYLTYCWFDGPVDLQDAQAQRLDFGGGRMPKVNADGRAFNGVGLKTTRDLHLSRGFSASGMVDLYGAEIGGDVRCDGAQLENDRGWALDAEALVAKGAILLRNGFSATGGVRLYGAEIGGNLACDGGSVRNDRGWALDAEGLVAKGAVNLRHGFSAVGGVRLYRAQIGKNLSCVRARLENKTDWALDASDMVAGGAVLLRHGFHAIGGVRLFGAQIGSLECDGARLESQTGWALNAEGVVTKGAVVLREGFEADGGVRMYNAKIGGNLDCDSGRLTNKRDWAFHAEKMVVEGAVLLRNGFRAIGGVRLYDAKVGGNLDCASGVMTNDKGWAFNGEKIVVSGAAYLRYGFSAVGGVRLFDAEIGGTLDCAGGRFEHPGNIALSLYRAQIAGQFEIDQRPSKDGRAIEMFEGALDLRNAHIGRLRDALDCWPQAGGLRLDGFTYNGFTEAPTDWRVRREWLLRQPEQHLRGDFRPQPWEQLEQALLAQGKVYDAKRIGVEKEKTQAHTLPLLTRPFHWLHGLIAGYGYFTPRAAWLSLAMIVLGAFVFDYAWRAGVMVPAHEVLLDADEWQTIARSEVENPAAEWGRQPPGSDYVSFNSWLYSFDVFIPIVTIELEPAWAPSSARGAPWRGAPLGQWISYFRIFHEAMGYVLTSFIILGAARLVRESGAR